MLLVDFRRPRQPRAARQRQPAPVSRPPSREEQKCSSRLQPAEGVARAAVGAAQRAVKNSGAALYAIGMGTGKGAYVDLENLEILTADSGGYVEAINDPAEITAAVARMFDELQSQYMLAFEPAHADGKYHEISVTTKNRDLRVRARAGYTAAEKVEEEAKLDIRYSVSIFVSRSSPAFTGKVAPLRRTYALDPPEPFGCLLAGIAVARRVVRRPALSAPRCAQQPQPYTKWDQYGGSSDSMQYSALAQINKVERQTTSARLVLSGAGRA